MARVTATLATTAAALLGDDVDVDGLLTLAKMHEDVSSVHAPGMLQVAGGRRRKRPVQKDAKKLLSGYLASYRRLAGTTKLPTGPAGQADRSAARAAGQAARADFDAFARTKTGKAVLIAGGTGAGYKALGGGKKTDPYTGQSRGMSPVTVGVAAAAGTAGVRAVRRASALAKSDELDVTWSGTFSKLDEGKRLAFGWASVVELNGQPVIDRQGDVISVDEIENATYDYMLKSRIGGDMHRRTADDKPVHVSDVVESVIFTPEKCTAMGISKALSGHWWLGVKIHDEQSWQSVKKGERTGFSVHGKGLRKSTTVEELMMGLST